MAIRIILTYKDYEVLPADGRRYELHEGELSVTPAPSPRHQEISGNLFIALSDHVKRLGRGKAFYAPIDCILSDTTIVQPDLVYLATDRMAAISGRGIEGPPTLVIEILSPSTTQIDRSVKFQLYARYGVPYCWIVDPDARTIEAHDLAGNAYELTGRMEGERWVGLHPFPELPLEPASVWP